MATWWASIRRAPCSRCLQLLTRPFQRRLTHPSARTLPSNRPRCSDVSPSPTSPPRRYPSPASPSRCGADRVESLVKGPHRIVWPAVVPRELVMHSRRCDVQLPPPFALSLAGGIGCRGGDGFGHVGGLRVGWLRANIFPEIFPGGPQSGRRVAERSFPPCIARPARASARSLRPLSHVRASDFAWMFAHDLVSPRSKSSPSSCACGTLRRVDAARCAQRQIPEVPGRHSSHLLARGGV